MRFLIIVVRDLRTRFRVVNKWPGQEEAAGDSKVGPIIIQVEHGLNLIPSGSVFGGL